MIKRQANRFFIMKIKIYLFLNKSTVNNISNCWESSSLIKSSNRDWALSDSVNMSITTFKWSYE